jgi:hypothetical protein
LSGVVGPGRLGAPVEEAPVSLQVKGKNFEVSDSLRT